MTDGRTGGRTDGRTMRTGSGGLAALVALCVAAGSLHAQAAEPDVSPAATALAPDTNVVDTVAVAAGSDEPLPPWKPQQPAVVRTLVEITAINAFAVAVNTFGRGIAGTNPSSMWQNLQGGWEWDPNDVRVNHFEHPYAGAAYFNSARANGLSFWGSAPMALAGSVMWEIFGETKPPSINDVLSTAVTGISLGEPLRRVSLMVLDEESKGLDRVWREVAVFLANPGLGLNRLGRGQSWSRRQNMPGRRPDALRGGVSTGVRQLAQPSGAEPLTAALAGFNIDYGDPFAGGERGPFSSFTGSLELLTSSPDLLGSLGARGLLVAFGPESGPLRHVGGLFMDFDYRRDGVVDFAQQSFGVGLLSRFPIGDGAFRVATDVSAEAVPILAVRDIYAAPLVVREYDYAAGVGARTMAQLEYRGRRVLSASYRAYWGPTLNGASTTKLVQLAAAEARLPIVGSMSIGAGAQLYWQRSTYAERPPESESLPGFSLFLSTGY